MYTAEEEQRRRRLPGGVTHMSTSTLVNGQPAELGCYVDGHWGQYGPDRLAEQAEAFGWPGVGSDDDPRYIRDLWGDDDPRGKWECYAEAADRIEQWLNNVTTPGHIWHWHDGEFFLSSICDDPDECTDDTCAHWE